ncbi:restriction endonuclease subunit S [Prevotella pallens]|uniref:restriction endonuclease subunit S n=3 Tax=Prevotella TaxID=838 RepID=UPI00352E93A1
MKLYKKHISDLGKVITGKTPRTSILENYGGKIPFLTPSDNLSEKFSPTTSKTLTKIGLNEVKNCLLPSKSICVSCIGSDLGKVVLTKKPTVTNQQFNSIVPNEENDADFIYYLMTVVGKHLNYLSKTSTAVPIINKSTFANYEIEIPNIKEQKRIGKILSSLDDKIELNRRINDNLEQQAQALFKSWFVNFEPFKNGQFVDSELGKIPKGWKVGYLSEIADIIMGQSPNGSTYNENGEGIIFYQGRAEFGTRFPSIRLFTTNPTRIAPANSILISVRAPVGDINITHKECCIGRGLASAVSRTNKSAFLLYTLFSLKSDLDRFNAEGTVFGSINRKALETLKILIPTNDIISKFEAIVASMDQQILILHIESENLKILRDTLLPKLMSGERSVIHKENNDD